MAPGGSDDLSKFIFEHLSDAIFAIDGSGKVQRVNPAAERMFDYPMSEMVDRNVDLFVFDSAAIKTGSLPEVSTGKGSGAVGAARSVREASGRRRDGTVFALELSIGSFRFGGAGYVTVIARNVSERKPVQETNAQLAALVSTARDAIVGADRDGVVTSWNRGAERMYGYGSEEVLGRSIDLLFPAELEAEERAISGPYGGAVRELPDESFGMTKDGRRINVLVTSSPIELGEGEVVGISKIAREITQYKQSIPELESRDALMDHAIDPILIWEPGRGIVFWNEGARRTFGYSAEEALGSSSEELLRKVFPSGRQECEARLTEQGTWEGELRCLTKDGRWLTVESKMSLVRQEGRTEQLLEIDHDITERKQVEEQLRDAGRLLSESQRLARVGSWEVDLGESFDLNCATWRGSDECYRIFGDKRSESPADIALFLAVVHAEDRERVRETMNRAVVETGGYSIEHRIVRPNGDERVVLACGEVSTDSSARPIRMIGTCQDITERSEAEKALRSHATLMENLRAIDVAVLSTRAPRQIAAAALAHVGRHIPFWTAAIAVNDFEAGNYEVIASEGLLRQWYPPGSRFELEIETFTEADSRAQGRIWNRQDSASEKTPNVLMDRLRVAGMQSYVLQPLRDANRAIGMLFMASDGGQRFSTQDVEIARELADHVAIAVRQSRLLEEVESSRSRLAELTRRLLRAQEDERRHIARELHDEIGQTLTAVKIHLQLVDERAIESTDARLRHDETIAMIDRALTQIRGISLDLRPLYLDDFGLVATLTSYISQQGRLAGFSTKFEVSARDRDFRLEPELETACFRVTQEALTNIARYAAASQVEVVLRLSETELEIMVRDDGRGFDLSEARARVGAGTSLGLLGMQERVSLVGGQFKIHSTPGKGTEVSARFPLVSSVDETWVI